MQAGALQCYLRDTVVPFSVFYRSLFQRAGICPGKIQTREDLARIPFTSKKDLLKALEEPGREKDFWLMPDKTTLQRRPAVWVGDAALGTAQNADGPRV